jgi:chorismate mutase
MFAVRGATTVENDDKDEILSATNELVSRMLEDNNINVDDIISIIFTCTRDLKSVYPSKAVRDMGIVYAGLLCFQEMYVENSMEKCIRVLMHVNGSEAQKNVSHIFLREAINLRPDLMQEFKKKY